MRLFNPARARRSHLAQITRRERLEDDSGNVFYEDVPDAEWQDTPAYLTPGHFETREARQAAEIATKARTGEARYLGRGNFGEAFLVTTERGPVVVKVAAEVDIHGRRWSLEHQRQNFLHEAGVANELEEAGSRIVPRTVYVELPGGVPALVREYGVPVKRWSARARARGLLTVQEFEAVEQELVAVENAGWRVQDTIDLYRRRDGSIFVGDVGLWNPESTRYDGSRDRDTALSGRLDELGRKMFSLPDQQSGWTLPSVLTYASRIQKYMIEPETDVRSISIFLKYPVQYLEKALAVRQQLGLSTPESVKAALLAGKRFLASAVL